MSHVPPTHVVIAGGGIIGTSIAYHLASTAPAAEGLKVTVVDPCASPEGFTPPAASARAGGFLALDWNGGSPLDELSRASYAMHMETFADAFPDCDYRPLRTVFVNYRKRRGDEERGAVPGAPYLDGPDLSVRDVQELGDEATTAQVHPAKLCGAMQRAALATGRLELVQGSVVGVDGGEEGGGGEGGGAKAVRGVTLAGGDALACDCLVVAMGPWTERARSWGIPELRALPRVLGQKYHSIRVPAASDACAAFTQGLPATLGADTEAYPRPDGTVYVCGESLPPAVVEEEPGAVAALPEAIAQLRRNAASMSSAMAAGAAEAEPSSCHLPVLEGRALPLFGPLPRWGGSLHVATGHSCWGILNAPATGAAVAELILTGDCETLSDATPFLPA